MALERGPWDCKEMERAGDGHAFLVNCPMEPVTPGEVGLTDEIFKKVHSE